MDATSAFGEFARQKRIQLGLTLREFCRRHGYDVVNMSKVERGRLSPPQKRSYLERYAQALGVQEGSDDWMTFFDLASSCAGRVPDRVMSDPELLPKLPLIFRTISGKPVSSQKLRELAEEIRRT